MPNKRFILKKLPEGAEIPITGNLTVGRNPDCGLRLVEGSPSREHALFTLENGAVFLEDQGSRNGTFVNGKRLDSKVKLKANDKVRFDIEQYEFRVEYDAAEADQTALRVGEADRVAGGGPMRRPPGWVEEQKQTADKTLLFSREQRRNEQKRIVSSGVVEAAFDRVDVPQLVVLGEPDGGLLRVELKSATSGQAVWTVGSEGARDILIKRDGVSALHAKIVNEGSRWQVIDQFSANGTFVNGRQCTKSFLGGGDRISFGPVECIFQLPTGSAAAAPPTAWGESPSQPGAATGRASRSKAPLAVGVVIVLGILIALAYLFRYSLLSML